MAAELMKPDCQQTGLVVNYSDLMFSLRLGQLRVSSLVLGFICTASKLSENLVRCLVILSNLFVHAFYRNLPV